MWSEENDSHFHRVEDKFPLAPMCKSTVTACGTTLTEITVPYSNPWVTTVQKKLSPQTFVSLLDILGIYWILGVLTGANKTKQNKK